jgi:hypothetical protein
MPTWSHSRVLIAALVLGTASGCASTAVQQCANADWYNVGLEDGRAGQAAEQFVQRWETCTAHGVRVDRERYAAGRAAGLQDYCTVTGGIEAGRSGRLYQNVCSEASEEEFLSGYYMGALSPEP